MIFINQWGYRRMRNPHNPHPTRPRLQTKAKKPHKKEESGLNKGKQSNTPEPGKKKKKKRLKNDIIAHSGIQI